MAEKHLTLTLIRNQREIADKCIVADRFWSRLKGLMGVTHFEQGRACLFPKCNSIHMWFMKIPIDVLFLKQIKNGFEVISIKENLQPWRLFPVSDFKATHTLELPEGTIHMKEIKIGDEVCIS